MSVFRSRESRQWTPEPIVPPFPGVDVFGGGTTQNMTSAMRQSAVWACVRLLADTVSMMPLGLYDNVNGVRVQVEPSRTERKLLERPGGDALLSDFLYMLMVSVLLRGNAYGKCVWAANGYPQQIDLVNPDELNITVNASTGALEIRDKAGNLLDLSDYWRIAAYRMPGMKLGLSPIQYHASTIATDAEVQRFALGYFRDALHPQSVLTSEQSITQGDAQSLIERLRGKRGSREPIVLGAGLKFTPLSVSPNESQFLETQKYGVSSIARVFGVPPEMIGAEAGNSLTYANVEQRSIDFLTYSIQPWLTRIEAAMACWFPGTKHPRFDTNVLLRTDLETRMRAGAIAVASKQFTPDETRGWSDAPPLTKSQKKLLQIVPLVVTPTGKPAQLPGTVPGVDFDPPDSSTSPTQPPSSSGGGSSFPK